MGAVEIADLHYPHLSSIGKLEPVLVAAEYQKEKVRLYSP